MKNLIRQEISDLIGRPCHKLLRHRVGKEPNSQNPQYPFYRVLSTWLMVCYFLSTRIHLWRVYFFSQRIFASLFLIQSIPNCTNKYLAICLSQSFDLGPFITLVPFANVCPFVWDLQLLWLKWGRFCGWDGDIFWSTTWFLKWNRFSP